MTLPSYISSSEEILKHASKLLKAEFPVSLRLMGGYLNIVQFLLENMVVLCGFPSLYCSVL